MRTRPTLVGAALLLLLTAGRGASEAAPSDSRELLAPCRLPGLEEEVRCGTLEVSEDRETGRGRRIPIRFAVLPATGSAPNRDPLVVLPGGPGLAATGGAGGWAEYFAQVRRSRDLLLVDMRGTGGSDALPCALYGGSGPLARFFGEMFPPSAVESCRRRLEGRADLRQYTTTHAAQDLDDVRAALGYERINLFGTSYGTRLAQAYLRLHPGRVRSVILKGVVPSGYAMPSTYARDAQEVLTRLLGDCAADGGCSRAFPGIDRELRAVLERLERSPATVSLALGDGPAENVRLDRGTFGENLRNMLYNRKTLGAVPLTIHRAFRGDLRPIAEFTLRLRRSTSETLAMGAFLSVTCAEDIPFLDLPRATRESSNTLLGDYRLRQQVENACRLWPRGKVRSGFRDPVRSDVPALVVSGAYDPVTPPRNGAEVARFLPKARAVVFPFESHSGIGSCHERLFAEFLEEGSAAALDDACVGEGKPPVFELPSPSGGAFRQEPARASQPGSSESRTRRASAPAPASSSALRDPPGIRTAGHPARRANSASISMSPTTTVSFGEAAASRIKARSIVGSGFGGVTASGPAIASKYRPTPLASRISFEKQAGLFEATAILWPRRASSSSTFVTCGISSVFSTATSG